MQFVRGLFGGKNPELYPEGGVNADHSNSGGDKVMTLEYSRYVNPDGVQLDHERHEKRNQVQLQTRNGMELTVQMHYDGTVTFDVRAKPYVTTNLILQQQRNKAWAVLEQVADALEYLVKDVEKPVAAEADFAWDNSSGKQQTTNRFYYVIGSGESSQVAYVRVWPGQVNGIIVGPQEPLAGVTDEPVVSKRFQFGAKGVYVGPEGTVEQDADNGDQEVSLALTVVRDKFEVARFRSEHKGTIDALVQALGSEVEKVNQLDNFEYAYIRNYAQADQGLSNKDLSADQARTNAAAKKLKNEADELAKKLDKNKAELAELNRKTALESERKARAEINKFRKEHPPKQSWRPFIGGLFLVMLVAALWWMFSKQPRKRANDSNRRANTSNRRK